VLVGGLPGTGKSTLARTLAAAAGFDVIRSDVVRKELAGLRATDHRPEAFGRGLYSRGMTMRTYAVLRRRAARWLRRGQSVVLDATYGQPTERAALRRLARSSGSYLVVLVCQADEAVLRARLAARAHDATSASDARPALWPALRAAFAEPTELPEAVPVDTGQTLAASAGHALARLRAAAPTHVRVAGAALGPTTETRAAT
jgi:predicted kinase